MWGWELLHHVMDCDLTLGFVSYLDSGLENEMETRWSKEVTRIIVTVTLKDS